MRASVGSDDLVCGTNNRAAVSWLQTSKYGQNVLLKMTGRSFHRIIGSSLFSFNLHIPISFRTRCVAFPQAAASHVIVAMRYYEYWHCLAILNMAFMCPWCGGMRMRRTCLLFLFAAILLINNYLNCHRIRAYNVEYGERGFVGYRHATQRAYITNPEGRSNGVSFNCIWAEQIKMMLSTRSNPINIYYLIANVLFYFYL